MKKYGGLEYEKHKEFVVWDSVETGAGSSQDKYCRQTLKQNFDINNDGTDEFVIRTRHCYKDQLTDRLYIFPLNSNAVELLKDQGPLFRGDARPPVALSLLGLMRPFMSVLNGITAAPFLVPLVLTS